MIRTELMALRIYAMLYATRVLFREVWNFVKLLWWLDEDVGNNNDDVDDQDGAMFLVVEGDTWEYWEPGEYKNSDKEFSCMAIATDGLKIYLSQVKISTYIPYQKYYIQANCMWYRKKQIDVS